MKLTNYWIAFCGYSPAYEAGNEWNSPLLPSKELAIEWAQQNGDDTDEGWAHVSRQIVCESLEEAALLKEAQSVADGYPLKSAAELQEQFPCWSQESCEQEAQRIAQHHEAFQKVTAKLGEGWAKNHVVKF